MADTTGYILDFTVITAADRTKVGGKCASLGDMTQAGVNVPPGFAVTTDAYQRMLYQHGLRDEIERHLVGSNWSAVKNVRRTLSGRLTLICQSAKTLLLCKAVLKRAFAKSCGKAKLSDRYVRNCWRIDQQNYDVK
jgi:phosphoenolpyruvate synthase/pyruvate phosphate dikinase